MLFLVLASALLVTVYGQAADPTKVCLPDVLQVVIASLTTNISGVIAYNFPNKFVAFRYNNGFRSVFNLDDGTVARINESDSSCARVTPPSSYISLVSQCLPASAKLHTPADTYFGLSPNRLDIQAWIYDVESFATVHVGVTTGSPSVPVIRHFVTSSTSSSDISVLLNPKTTIEDATIFAVPDDCPAQTFAG